VVASRGMLPGVVAIDVPDETPIEWVVAAAQACEAALGTGRCVRDASTGDVGWRAVIVLAEGGAPVLRIELYSAASGAMEAVRRLQFLPIDPERQRWASAGVVVAAMVRAREAGIEETTEVPEKPPPPPQIIVDPPDPLPSPPRPAPKPAVFWVDLGGRAASGLEGEALAWGGGLRATGRPLQNPLLLSAQVTMVASGGVADSLWVTLQGGGGVRLLETAPLHLDVLGDILAQRYQVALTSVGDARTETDEGGLWRLGVAANLILDWPVYDPLRGFIGVEAQAFSPAIQINAGGEEIGHLSALGWGVCAGVRWVVPQ
jgi:hypothetical protein